MAENQNADAPRLCFAKYQRCGALDAENGRLALIALTGNADMQPREFHTIQEFIAYTDQFPKLYERLFENPMTLPQFLNKYSATGLTRDQLIHVFDFYNHDGLIRSESLK